MGQLIRPGSVRIITKDGELVIQLTLDININLNQTGGINIAVSGEKTKMTMTREDTHEEDGGDEDDSSWAIPDFSAQTKLDFGQTIKGED